MKQMKTIIAWTLIVVVANRALTRFLRRRARNMIWRILQEGENMQKYKEVIDKLALEKFGASEKVSYLPVNSREDLDKYSQEELNTICEILTSEEFEGKNQESE